MKNRAIPLILIALTALAGCANTLQTPPDGEDPAAQLFTLPPNTLGHHLSASQLASGTYAGNNFKMRFEIEVSREKLTLVGISDIGLTLFTLIQSEDGISVDSHLGKPLPFDPRYVLFDIYFMFWPADALQQALSRSGRVFTEDEDKKGRALQSPKGDLLVELTAPAASDGYTFIRHYDIPYHIQIKTFELVKKP